MKSTEKHKNYPHSHQPYKSTLLQDMMKGLNRKRLIKENSITKVTKGDENEKTSN